MRNFSHKLLNINFSETESFFLGRNAEKKIFLCGKPLKTIYFCYSFYFLLHAWMQSSREQSLMSYITVKMWKYILSCYGLMNKINIWLQKTILLLLFTKILSKSNVLRIFDVCWTFKLNFTGWKSGELCLHLIWARTNCKNWIFSYILFSKRKYHYKSWRGDIKSVGSRPKTIKISIKPSHHKFFTFPIRSALL